MPRPPASNQRDWYTTPEVAEVFEVSTETVRDWIAVGKLKAEKVNTYNRVSKEEIARFARERYDES